MTGTGVQSFGGHDEQIRLLKGHRIGLGLPELTGKDADPMPTKAGAPALKKLVCEGAKRRQVDRPLALVENLRDGLLGQPRLAAPGGQLEDDAEPAPQKTLVVNLPLRRIQLPRNTRLGFHKDFRWRLDFNAVNDTIKMCKTYRK